MSAAPQAGRELCVGFLVRWAVAQNVIVPLKARQLHRLYHHTLLFTAFSSFTPFYSHPSADTLLFTGAAAAPALCDARGSNA